MIDFTNVKSITYGGDEVKQVSLNGDILWKEKSDALPYLCFTAQEANSSVMLNKVGALTKEPAFETSMDGTNWTPYTFGTNISLQSVGDKVYWRGDNETLGENSKKYCNFAMTGAIAASGNVMSLLDTTLQITAVPQNGLRGLFRECTALTTAPDLPVATLGENCYSGMFTGCAALTAAPYLPATVLPGNCYTSLFNGCSSLSSISVAFTNWQGGQRTLSWVSGVATSGTFYCPSALLDTRGAAYIPEGWTIIRTD